MPPDRPCETTIALGWKMGKRGKAQGGPVALVAWDALSGRESLLRAAWAVENVPYAGQGPAETGVELSEPRGGRGASRHVEG
jgi:hypothetical protein